LNHNKLLSKQFGFKELNWTVDDNLAIQQKVITLLNNKQKFAIITIDLKKAFDLISYNLLLIKLKNYGCDSVALNWFKSYLSNRCQFVKYNNQVSDFKSSNIGVQYVS
jgi:hypothetical protein